MAGVCKVKDVRRHIVGHRHADYPQIPSQGLPLGKVRLSGEADGFSLKSED